jgi:poly(beta-D-mannuronate) lyase
MIDRLNPPAHFIFLVMTINLLLGTNTIVSSAAEISTAMNSANPGDTLTMTNGLWVDQHIIFAGTGTDSQPILLQAENPGHVILTGTSTLRIGGSHLIVDGLYFRNGYSASGGVIEFRRNSSQLADHCRLTNTAIVDYNPQSINTNYKWVSIYGSYNRVDNCYFRGKNHDGATLVVWFQSLVNPLDHHHLIDHNYFAYRPELGFNGGETIRIGTSSYSMYDFYTTVEWNYFEHCNGEIEIISNKSGENIFRYNTFYESEGTLTLRHGNRATVRGNFFLGNGQPNTGGVRIIGEDHKVYNNYFHDLQGSGYRSAITLMNGVPNSPLNRYFQVQRAEISHNTIINCYQPFLIGAGSDNELTLPPLDCIIANNTVLTNNAYVIFNLEDDPINMNYTSNIVWGASLGLPDTTSGILVTDPQMELAADSLWRPQTGSPLIGAATDLFSYITDDMDGQVRNGAYDIGADQESSDSVVIYPLSSSDVGPYWLNSVDTPVFIVTNVSGSGTITLDPDTNIFMPGDTVVISAIPDSGWGFLEWSGDITGSNNPQMVIVNDDMYITAVFSPPVQYQIYEWIVGTGEIAYNPPGPYYNPSTSVEISAIPGDGWLFSNWSGDWNGSQNPDTVILNSDMAITATFTIASSIDGSNTLPAILELLPNYPNPFNNSTRIVYQLPSAAQIFIRIYSINGREVFASETFQELGLQDLDWQTDDLSSGIYILKLISLETTITQKLLLVR